MDIPVEKLTNIIYACFVLHNFCEEVKDEVNANFVEKIVQEERRPKLSVDKLNSYTSLAGRKVRRAMTSYFKEYLQFFVKKTYNAVFFRHFIPKSFSQRFSAFGYKDNGER